MERKEIYESALKRWGIDCQLHIAMEECGELVQAIAKFLRFQKTDMLKEEIADVKIMIEQMENMFGIEKDVQIIMEQKIKRLEKRVFCIDDSGK